MTYQALSEALAAPQLAPATLSTAQIADLHNTGVEVVPAPGVGKMIVPLGFAGKKTLNSVAFGAGGDIKLVYGTDGDINASPFKAADVIVAASDKLFVGVPNSSTTLLDVAAMENKALCVKLTEAANPTTGPIAAFTIAGGGANYLVNDVLTVSPVSFGSGATITVDTVDGGGAILTAHVSAGGFGYSVENGALAEGGAGTGASINITDVTEPPAGNGSVTASVIYAIVDV